MKRSVWLTAVAVGVFVWLLPTFMAPKGTRADQFFYVGILMCLAISFWLIAYHIGKYARMKRVGPMRKPLCPKCGYNLTGLSEARCPECGERFTLDQLWSAWVRAYVGVDTEDEL